MGEAVQKDAKRYNYVDVFYFVPRILLIVNNGSMSLNKPGGGEGNQNMWQVMSWIEAGQTDVEADNQRQRQTDIDKPSGRQTNSGADRLAD